MIAPAELVRSHGGRYATALDIDLAATDSGERFKWLLAAILFGTRISEQLATRTWHEFAARGVLAPQRHAGYRDRQCSRAAGLCIRRAVWWRS